MNAQQLKNSILQEAIQGRLVPQDPNDEPASVLLQRIRKEKERLVKEKKIVLSKPEKNVKVTDDVPFPLPSNWTWALVNDVCRVFGRIGFRGYSKNDLRNSKEGSAISLSPSNMVNGILDWSSCTYISEEKYDESPEIQIKDGDLLIVKTGSSYGKTSIVKHLPWKATINPQIAVVKEVKIDSGYLKYFFQSSFAQSCLKSFVLGTSIPTFSQFNLISMYIPLPPLSEQHRIVSKIEELLPKVEAYGRAQESLDKLNAELPDRLKKSILQEAIEGRLVPQDPNDEPASVLLERIRAEKKRLVKEGKLKKKDLEETPISEDEKPFEIPENWEWTRLGWIIDFSKSSSISSDKIDGDSWLLDLEDIEKDTGRLLTKKRMKEVVSLSDKRHFQKGDVLYSKLRPYLNKVIIADEDGYCTTEILSFDFGLVFNKYAQYYLMSPYFVAYAMLGSFGTKMPRLSSKHGNEAPFPLPPLCEQHRIVSKIEQLLKEIDKLNK